MRPSIRHSPKLWRPTNITYSTRRRCRFFSSFSFFLAQSIYPLSFFLTFKSLMPTSWKNEKNSCLTFSAPLVIVNMTNSILAVALWGTYLCRLKSWRRDTRRLTERGASRTDMASIVTWWFQFSKFQSDKSAASSYSSAERNCQNSWMPCA